MASIKPIDSHSVHQIQSGQVIVDLCSVAKELVENSIDSGATTIDVRFKNQGLDVIEVQDNGSGISPANYASVALKHHTSKLSSYADIGSLQTFGFRGEALASLCALSSVTVTTCLSGDAPKGTKLSFEASGQLKSTSMVASQRGTTVTVEQLFKTLPVRRRELERSIKREWQKVIILLNQYACIQTNLKFSVSQQPNKGKRIALFSTHGNTTTRENIINVFGAKTMNALVPLHLEMEMRASVAQIKKSSSTAGDTLKTVCIVGHVSRPAHGSGRQTPDRQMFFVNGRPCSLPQVARAINEVYKAFNTNQAPFILADIQLDTNMYDVNVSPDKRSILLHDQGHLLDNLRDSLTQLFDTYDHSVPVSQPAATPAKATLVEGSSTEGSVRQRREPSMHRDESRTSQTSKRNSDLDSTGPGSNADSETERLQGPDQKRQRTRITTSRVVAQEGYDQDLISRWIVRGDTAPDAASALVTFRHGMPVADGSQATVTKAEPGPPSLHQFRSTGNARKMETASGQPHSLDFVSARMTLIADSERASETSQEPPSPGSVPDKNRQNNSRLSAGPTVKIGDHIISNMSSSPEQVDARRERSQAAVPTFGKSLSNLYSASSVSRSRPTSNRDSSVRIREQSEEEDEIEEESDREEDEDQNRTDGVARSYKDRTAGHGFPANLTEATDEPKRQGNAVDSAAVSSSARPATPSESAAAVEDEMSAEKTTGLSESSAKDAAFSARATSVVSGPKKKDTTFKLAQNMEVDISRITAEVLRLASPTSSHNPTDTSTDPVEDISAPDAEEKLPLIISKSDFAKMSVAGQFNMGFIIAVRRKANGISMPNSYDELFIIDQHASDEKYNYERLQANTVVQSQRLVHPKRLELTALEEEIVMHSMQAIEANGFKVNIDTSGNSPVGARCELLALPLSRETTFSLADFEELISLLADESSDSSHVPRPSRVRKMFAMRACRSSIMIGKALNVRQMQSVIRHMGDLDKPWNCPHGRPTMRHLCQLGAWDDKRWKEDSKSVDVGAWRAFSGV